MHGELDAAEWALRRAVPIPDPNTVPTELFLGLWRFAAEEGLVTIQEFARKRSISRHAVHHRLVRAGLPKPSRVRRWGALTAALLAWRDSPEGLCRAARATGWSDGFIVSNALVEESGMRPTEWRARGGDPCELSCAFVATWKGVG